jgi:hypothetical protein
MSDIEEVVIPKSNKPKKDTKPEIARQKMKEKRERLKKEKEDSMINEAKNRLAQELELKKVEEQKKIVEEEEKKKQDPIYQIRLMLEQLTNKEKEVAVKPTKKISKKVVPVEVEEEPVYVEEVKIPKKRVSRKKVEDVVEQSKPTRPPPKLRAPRKKKVVEESPTTQFYGEAPEPEPQEIYYAPTNPLLERMAMRRRMGSYY